MTTRTQLQVDAVITEGIIGYWHYHLSEPGKTTRGLCGARTMHTAMHRSAWRVPFGQHFPKRPTWCEKCESLDGQRGE